jgi:pyridoxal phosphate enzyme (YggS family)
MSIADNIISAKNVSLIAVSKTKTVADIQEAYNAGQRLFGENTVQEMVEKYEQLPKDIEWHQIGHLQTNKVKYIAPFISMIQSVDSLKLLQEINKQAEKNNRVIDCLLQIYIADEETKFGLGFDEAVELKNIRR